MVNSDNIVKWDPDTLLQCCANIRYIKKRLICRLITGYRLLFLFVAITTFNAMYFVVVFILSCKIVNKPTCGMHQWI